MNIYKEMWRIYNDIDISIFEPYKEEWNSNWFQYYQLKSIYDMKKWISYCNTKYPPHIYNNKLVIDMGCGWGLFSILCFLQGAKKVFAIGPDKRVDFLHMIIKDFGFDNCIETTKLYFDINTNKLTDKKVNVIIGNEFIEHLTYKQRKSFFKVANTNLFRNGILLLHTHNTDNRKVLGCTRRHWEKQEKKFYCNMRKEIISRNFHLNDEEIKTIALATYGMCREDILRICRNYIKDRIIPEPKLDLCSIHPETGIPDENFISPQTVKSEISQSGFSVRRYPWFGSSCLGKILRNYSYKVPFFLFTQIVKSITFCGIRN